MRRVARSISALPLVLACVGDPTPAPDPAYAPADVVRFQLEALASNGDPEADAGIAVTFRFASPANKAMTGPFDHFVGIVRAPAYRPLLGHVAAEYGELVVEDDYAAQVVSITARDATRHRYVFELSRQQGGPFDGCWMTDSVYAVDSEPDPGVAI